jgi:hypothetical protein
MRIIGDIILAGLGQLKNARIDNLAQDPASPSIGQVWLNTTDGVYRGFDGTSILTFATKGALTAFQTEIDAIETGAGLATDGSYVVPTGTNYLNASSSLADATLKLDAQIASSAAAIAAEVTRATGAEQTNAAAIAAEVTRATGAEQTNAAAIAAEVTRATSAEEANATAIADEVTRAKAAEQVNTTAITAEVTRATGAEQALDTRVTAVEGSYVKKDGSVVYTGDQSMGGFKLTSVGDAVNPDDAVNLHTLQAKLGSLGNVFNYVTTLTGGADSASAFDLSTLPADGQNPGDYYKVTTGGYFKNGADAPFQVATGDGLVHNTTGGWDVIAHVDTLVFGSTGEITVTGDVDAGFTIDIAQTFKDRVSAVETNLGAEVTRATSAEQANAAAIAAETTRATGAEQTNADAIAAEETRAKAAEQANAAAIAAEVTRATGAEQTNAAAITAEATRATGIENGIQAELDAAEAAIGLTTAGAFTPLTGTNYLGSASTVVALSVALDTVIKGVADRLAGSLYVYDGSTSSASHTVTHNLGQKYCNVTVVDSNDKVIVPDSITYTDSNSLLVEFSTALTCKVIVGAPKAA